LSVHKDGRQSVQLE